MSVLLFIVGAIAVMAGAVMVGFGIPINEFSFGNTLIAAGATTFMGGLVILGLAAVVAQLQRVVEALATRPPLRASRPMEPFDQSAAARAAPASGRIPFPPKPKAESREPRPADAKLEPTGDVAHELAHDAGLTVAPTLRNPDEAPVAVDEADESPLSPFSSNGSDGAEKRHAAFDAGWARAPQAPARQPQTAFFDTMWPAPEPRSAKAPTSSEAKLERKFESKYESHAEPKHEAHLEFTPETSFETRLGFTSEPEAKSESSTDITPEPPAPPPAQESGQARTAGEVRAVAILKSGVVDGMGYTLYVDGSIEAELPQGTLRFASINELRSHLEKAS